MKNRSRILVVDDEDRNLRLMEAILIPLEYEVITASNGEEAIEKVRETSPDLILLDVMMPGIDGFEVAGRLKENEDTKIIPIVMVTALQEVEARVKALEAGADDFLSKPIDRTELRARVQSLLKVKKYNDYMRDHQRELEIEVSRKTKELRIAFEKIKKVTLETIIRLSRAAEYRDEDTAAHIMRMSGYSAVVAQKMGLSEEDVEQILHAAPMHDIGKIGIPDQILLKPGKLDPDEWKTMKQHTHIGGRILEDSDIELIKSAEIIALTHHEKWDGSGYPTGIKGEEIPLEGRIAAIADVFDALTSKRPYKEPFSVEKSFKIIREERGSHFDPDIVDAFFAVENEILSIKAKFSDENESLLSGWWKGFKIKINRDA